MAKTPAGWGRGTRRKLSALVNRADGFVQQLNDRFTNPSGQAEEAAATPTDEAEDSSPVTEARE
jgi:hypothetical protein